jgi:hypothetical protein
MVAFIAGDALKEWWIVGPGATSERKVYVDSVNVGASTVTYTPRRRLADPLDYAPVQQVNVPFASVTSKASTTPGAEHGQSPGIGQPNTGSFDRNRQAAQAFDRAVRNGGRAGQAAAVRADRARRRVGRGR